MTDPVIVVISEQVSPNIVVIGEVVSPSIVEIGAAGIPGPQGPAGSGGNVNLTGTNNDSVTLLAGQAAATHSSGNGFVRANATNNGYPCVGLIVSDVIATGAAQVQAEGPMQLSDWTNVTGTVSLSAKAKYYLDVNAGKLTDTPPAVSGNIVQQVGIAVALDTLLIEPLYSVKL